MKCSRGAVQTTLKEFQTTASYNNRPKPGRKRRTTERMDRRLERMALQDGPLSSKDVSTAMWAQHGVSLTASAVRRRLIAANLRAIRARKKLYLTKAHCEKRLAWAQKYRHWTVEDWSRVIFPDECNREVRFVCLFL